MTDEMKMMPLRQKQITDRIEKMGFKRSEFTFSALSDVRFEFIYKPNRFFCFSVDQNHNYKGKPGSHGKQSFHNKMNDWDHLMKGFETWLGYLKENVDVGDPWEEVISEQQKLNEETFGTYNETLSQEEQIAFAAKLDLMLDHFSALQLDVGKMQEDISHIKAQSSKISKKDLLLLFIGTVSSYMMSGIIPQDKASEIWHYIIDLFSITHNFLALQ